jgi:metal-responsive CopG/Arc/MetJ family transcriptional regulator
MKPTGENNSFSLPPALLAEVEAFADREHRPVADVLQDAVERYVREKRWQTLHDKANARAKALGLTEEDVPRLIAETRKELRQGRE